MEFLLCSTNTHTPLFFGVSKIHKPNFSLHSITLRCDHHTGRLSLYVTHFIQPLTNNLPSHIKDTKSFLDFIVNLPPLPSSTLLVTADVTFSCSNIPHDDCMSIVIQFMEKSKHLISSNCAPSHIVRAILDFLAKHYTFSFLIPVMSFFGNIPALAFIIVPLLI